MKTRSAKGAETRLRILLTAADLFHKQGVRATSPDDVIEASGTGKGQFYHYFKSKEGLVHEVLQSHLEAIKTGTGRIHYDVASWRDLEHWFGTHIEMQESFGMTRGCPFGTIGNELGAADELIRQDLSLIFEVVKNKLATFFTKEKAKGRLGRHADAERMADFCIATIQGAMLIGKIGRSSQRGETVVGEALAHLRRYAESSSRRGRARTPRRKSVGGESAG